MAESGVMFATDVTHIGTDKFLTVVDCGPSRLAKWKRLEREMDEEVARGLEEAFAIMGPPRTVLMDNGASFRSRRVAALLSDWHVQRDFRCAYYPEGNAVVERHHLPVKRMVARTGNLVQQCVYWYKQLPRGKEWEAPNIQWRRRRWFNPFVERLSLTEDGGQEPAKNHFFPGDRVYLRPKDNKVMFVWPVATVGRVLSRFKVEVDGFPRHIAHLRKVPPPWGNTTQPPRARGGGGAPPSRRQHRGEPPPDDPGDAEPRSGSDLGEIDDTRTESIRRDLSDTRTGSGESGANTAPGPGLGSETETAESDEEPRPQLRKSSRVKTQTKRYGYNVADIVEACEDIADDEVIDSDRNQGGV